ncbi:hypothetical protein HDV00_003114 [Rhizophlyctis rosea]|nr:hypothetical protein HDV00_003114 [Rhizophlyctis rosea]
MDTGDSEEYAPLKDHVFVSTGILKWTASNIRHIIESLGGRYVAAFSGAVTHCLCGKDGKTEWGQKTGVGSAKYKECKKNKIPFVNEGFIDEALAKKPKKLTLQEQLDLEVVGTVLHDMMHHMNFQGDGLATLKYLIDAGADTTALDEDDRTPLHILIYHKQAKEGLPVLDVLVEAMMKADPNSINQKDTKGYTAIQVAAARNRWSYVERLLAIPSIDFSTPFPFKTSLTAEGKTELINDGRGGRTLLHSAFAGRVALSVVEKIMATWIGSGLDLNVKELEWDRGTALHLVAAGDGGGESMWQHLLPLIQRKDVDVNATNANGETFLHLTFKRERPQGFLAVAENVEILRPDMNFRVADNDGQMLVHLASAHPSHFNLLRELLIQCPGDISAKTAIGNTPLATAIMMKNVVAAHHLLDLDADINTSVSTSGMPTVTHSLLRHALLSRGALNPVIERIAKHPRLNVSQAIQDALSASDAPMALRIIAERQTELQANAPALGRILHILVTNCDPKSAEAARICDVILELIEIDDETVGDWVAARSEASGGNNEYYGMTVMQVALLRSHHEIITSILAKLPSQHASAALTAKSATGESTFHILVRRNRVEALARYLSDLEKVTASRQNPSINEPDARGMTALHYALCPNPDWNASPLLSGDMVVVLLSVGANLFAVNGKGQSVAASMGALPTAVATSVKMDVLKYLQASGGDIKRFEKEFAVGKQAREKKDRATFQQNSKDLPQIKKLVKERAKQLEKMESLRAERAKKEVEDQRKNAHLLDVGVDTYFGDKDYKVLIEEKGGNIWDVVLTQVDLDYNVFGKNKFYNIQLLYNHRIINPDGSAVTEPEPAPPPALDNGLDAKMRRKLAREARRAKILAQKAQTAAENKAPFIVFTRWGRMGDGGYSYYSSSRGRYGEDYSGTARQHFDDIQEAKNWFENKFLDKTKNHWEDRDDFVKYANHYTYYPRFYRKKAEL